MQIYSVRLAKDKGPDYRGFVLVSFISTFSICSDLEMFNFCKLDFDFF